MADKLLDIQIVRAINAAGPLTRKQIITRVNDNQLDVEASLDAMVTMGCIRTELSTAFKGQFEYRLKPNFGESDCKRADHRQKVALYVSRHGAESKAVIPVTSGITFGEGLDRAIWKAANTGRWMMVREIRDILQSAGFRKDDIIARVQFHINTGRWFERQAGHRNSQFFMLRTDIECPPLPGEKPALRGETRIAVPIDYAGFLPTTTPEPPKLVPVVTELISELVAPSELEGGGYFPLSILDLNGEAMKLVREQVNLLVRTDFTLHEAIWAILSDGEEYSYADFVLLLHPYGFTDKQISPLLSKRFADGMLSRRLVKVGSAWVNVYKKLGELPEKFTSKKSVVSAILEAQQHTEVEVVAAKQKEVPQDVAETPELFEAKILIKGVRIGIEEFESLYKELYHAGFVRDMNKPTLVVHGARMLKTTHEIKGVLFDRDEVAQLTVEMHNLANRLRLALVV